MGRASARLRAKNPAAGGGAWTWNAYPATSFSGSPASGTWTITSPTHDNSLGNLDILIGYNGNGPGSWGSHGIIPSAGGVYTWTENNPGGFTIDSVDWKDRSAIPVTVATWRATGSSATVTP